MLSERQKRILESKFGLMADYRELSREKRILIGLSDMFSEETRMILKNEPNFELGQRVYARQNIYIDEKRFLTKGEPGIIIASSGVSPFNAETGESEFNVANPKRDLSCDAENVQSFLPPHQSSSEKLLVDYGGYESPLYEHAHNHIREFDSLYGVRVDDNKRAGPSRFLRVGVELERDPQITIYTPHLENFFQSKPAGLR